MNEFNTYEFVVARKKEGGYRAMRVLLMAGLILMFFVIFGVLCLTHLYPVIAVEVMVYLPFAVFAWKLSSHEYEYSMTSGVMTFTVVYGNRFKKKKLELFIKDMKEIAPYTDEAKDHLETLPLKKDYVFVSSLAAPDMYYAVFNVNDEDQVVYFEATAQALKILRFYNSGTVVTPTTR